MNFSTLIVEREYDGSHLTFSEMRNDFIFHLHLTSGEKTLQLLRFLFASLDKFSLLIVKIFTSGSSYDAVIMSQEQFEKIPMSKEYCVRFMQKQLDSLEDMLTERKRENRGKSDYSVKAIESAKKSLKAKIQKLTNPNSASKQKDNLLEFEQLGFEQLGFDYLVADEAHSYKNGFVQTKMTNVSGVTTKPSERAGDMQMKTDYFNEHFGQGHILFCTGTPVSNSMTELYVMTRYLRPDLLKDAGVERFDDWAATFGKVVTKNSQTSAGTLKLKTSFAKFANLPELMRMYKEFADIQSAEKLNLPRPKLKTGRPQIVVAKATPEQQEYIHNLAERAKKVDAGLIDPHDDNHLKIMGDARLVGLCNQAVKSLYEKRDEELPYDFIDDGESKVDKCIEKVAEIFEKTKDTKGVQIIFSDIAVNAKNGNFSVYEYMKNQLVKKGIPKEEIIFAPKADSQDRENIFRDINEGKYRVVIASTETLGTGANIQKNLYALHHIDVPWKPSDFEQREGRILCQFDKFTNFVKPVFSFKVSAEVCEFFVTTFSNVVAQSSKRSTPASFSKSGRKYFVIVLLTGVSVQKIFVPVRNVC